MDFSKINWEVEFLKKEERLKINGYKEVDYKKFYRFIFPEGSLQTQFEKRNGKGNIILSDIRPKGRFTRDYIIHDDFKNLELLEKFNFALIAPVSFFGKAHTWHNADKLFAIAIDVDYVSDQKLGNLLVQFDSTFTMKPTFLVSSGKGVHLYYVLEKPIDLYENVRRTLRTLKVALIEHLWNPLTSEKPDKPDKNSLIQGFRAVGSQTKYWSKYKIKAYEISGRRYSLDDFKNFEYITDVPGFRKEDLPGKNRHIEIDDLDLSQIYKKIWSDSKMSLTEAKEKYPDWYERKIVQKIEKKSKSWKPNKKMYDWWKEKIKMEAIEGGRYFAIRCLCNIGLKCGIPDQQIRKDAYSFEEMLNQRTTEGNEPFTRSDITSALTALNPDNRDKAMMSTRKWMEDNSKISIPPAKRNGRTREQHLKLARYIRDEINGHKDSWREGNGRPSAELKVKEWKKNNPAGKKIDCERELGISRHTVLKWW